MCLRLLRLFIFFQTALGVAACAPAEDVVVSGATMGTSYSVRVADCELPDCANQVRALAEARLAELTQALSHYAADSDISRFNRAGANEWLTVRADTVAVVSAAQQLSARTAGLFDATVVHAVQTWGFGPAAAAGQPPAAASIARSAAVIDYRDVESRAAPAALRKLRPGVGLDLSGIAKGYAVDQLAFLLDANGVRNYIVEIGGELRTRGVQANGRPWRIGIEAPPAEADAVAPTVDYIVAPGLSGVATSGDYRNYYMLAGQRIAHTIDPRTGRPVEHALASATVVATGATEADGLATALMVMGPTAAREFAREQRLAALLFERAGSDVRAWMTDEFRALLVQR